jgi:hypothetical protein
MELRKFLFIYLFIYLFIIYVTSIHAWSCVSYYLSVYLFIYVFVYYLFNDCQ